MTMAAIGTSATSTADWYTWPQGSTSSIDVTHGSNTYELDPWAGWTETASEPLPKPKSTPPGTRAPLPAIVLQRAEVTHAPASGKPGPRLVRPQAREGGIGIRNFRRAAA